MRSSTTVSLAGSAPALQQHREIVGLLDRVIARDDARSAHDGRLDHGIGDDLVVEHDREGLADIGGRGGAEVLPAAQVELELDTGTALLVESRARVGEVLAIDHDALLDRLRARAAVLVEGQALDIRRVVAGLRHEAEVELGGGSKKILEMLRVLKARHLDHDAVVALALDRRLLGAGGVDAAAQHLDRLVDSAVHASRDTGIGQLRLDERRHWWRRCNPAPTR